MKRALRACLCVQVLWMVACKDPSAAPEQAPAPPIFDERHLLMVDSSTVLYNGQELPWGAGPERWQEILGPRSRLVEGISVWDELGVFLYQTPKTSRPSSFEVLLGRTPHSELTSAAPEFWPRHTFAGRLVVDGAVISKSSKLSQINKDKKGPDFAPDYLGGIYSYSLPGFYLRLDFGHDRSLTSFSISRAGYDEP
jgi:hypothetical protein